MDTKKIVERCCEVAGAKNESQLCKMIGITQSNFIRRKKRNTAEEILFSWSLKNKFDLNYIFYGGEYKNYRLNDAFLKTIEIWLDAGEKLEPNLKGWFQIEFEARFPIFKKWHDKIKELSGKEE